jgi:hypothetical protein
VLVNIFCTGEEELRGIILFDVDNTAPPRVLNIISHPIY